MDRPHLYLNPILLVAIVAAFVMASATCTHASTPVRRLDPFQRVEQASPKSTGQARRQIGKSAAPRMSTRRFRVVIDPGHGGHDEGTVYDNGRVRIAEKDITLRLAQEAARVLRAQDIDVILTRETDRDIALPRRTALANRLQADIFISIHMNSTPTPMVSASPQGIETYILNNTTDASSRRIAEMENTPISVVDSRGSPEQMDIALILKDLQLDGNLNESKRLACAVQNELVHATLPERKSTHSSRNRGVKQALFHVLLGADMPSILVEAGFLTHPRDRAIALSSSGQKAVGRAIGNAVARYRGIAPLGASPPKHLAQLSSCRIN